MSLTTLYLVGVKNTGKPKLDAPIWQIGTSGFPGFSERYIECVHYVSLISLGFLGYVEH
jgi:hypothetical protein